MVLWLVFGAMAYGQSLPLGQIIDDVPCKADASQHYSLYLPSHFTPVRKWSIILAFDAGGRGRRAVERYQAAAEKYGYIIAGSNNSRNGPWEMSLNAAKAMTEDVEQRFPVDAKRDLHGRDVGRGAGGDEAGNGFGEYRGRVRFQRRVSG